MLSSAALRRAADGALMTYVELALILVYICVLLVKICNKSAESCLTFGFGSSASGVYEFFVIFGLASLLLLLTIGAMRLWSETAGLQPAPVARRKR